MLDEEGLEADSTEEKLKEGAAGLKDGLALDKAEVVATSTREELGDVTAGTEEARDVGGRLADNSGDEDGAAGPGLKELGAALLDGETDDDGVEVGTETGIIENDTGDELPGEGKGIAERDGMTAEDVIRAADEDGESTGEETTGEETTEEETTEEETTEEETTEEETTGTEMIGDAGTLPVGEVEGVALGVCTGTDGEATTMLDRIAEEDEGMASLEGDAEITALLEGVGVKTGVELGVRVTVELTVTVEQISCAGPRSLALSNSTDVW
ncbi:uncharacterized protein Aud_006746 [Aspergillus udagawae]|uniref:Uncharacterized protein n=1 Tax=Aspergillus udagawae TaxID=91492 RepID=A0A8E0UYA8_9EURO|nr:uncharacterized protein Aud_006746 [Aspergillus udagawae]GIC90312.1 hypothetical protein Aud_006746 [Aspergillus udagawae]